MKSFPLLFLLSITIFACVPSPKGENNTTPKTPMTMTTFEKGNIMNRREFWKIIDYSFNKSPNDKSIQEKIIIDKLVTYTEEEIIDFEITFRQMINEADDFKVMAAEKIIEGWVSGDPYLYFRCWPISQGKNTFIETIKNSEFLADKISNQTTTNFEELLYVATEAYKHKTGKKEDDDSFPRDIAMERDSQLDYDMRAPPTKGKDWTEDQLPKLYPKLWATFHD